MGLSSSLDAYNLSYCLLLAPFCESTLERGGRGWSWEGAFRLRGHGCQPQVPEDVVTFKVPFAAQLTQLG